MKHARPDYDRIQDPAGLIPEDEPVMIFRGQDKFAPTALRVYAREAFIGGAPMDLVDAVHKQAQAMDDWQANRRVKIPDL